MGLTLPDRILRRELGEKTAYSSIKGVYGDRAWVDDLDIVNELGGHTGCVNALRLEMQRNKEQSLMLSQLVKIRPTAGLRL